MSFSYTRSTELRNVDKKDLYKLALILDEENYWQTLMEIIPLEINNQTFGTNEDLEKIASGASYKRKYSNDHIRLIENAIRRPGESRLGSEIFFDEWGCSGLKYERPTLGVLLHLLVQSKHYRGADFVAKLLNEPKPSRPSDGPAAAIEFEVDVFRDIQEALNDTRFYPNTEVLQENVNNDINKDYYTKYKTVDKNISIINDNRNEPKITNHPKPPPRLIKLLKQQQQQQQLEEEQQQTLRQHHSNQLLQKPANKSNSNNQNLEEYSNRISQLDSVSDNENIPMLSFASKNIPNFSALMNNTNCETTETTAVDNSTASESLLASLSVLSSSFERITKINEDEDDSLSSTPSLICTKSNIVKYVEEQTPDLNSIPIVVLSQSLNLDKKSEALKSENSDAENLPALSALNVNGEQDIVGQCQLKQDNNFENVPFVAFNLMSYRSDISDECTDAAAANLPSTLEGMIYNHNSSKHQLDAIEEDYNGIEHEHGNDAELELDDDEDSIPNLSFLDNRSSNNESSLTNVTNTSGENSFEQSVNDCSSTSTDNVPILSLLNQ